MITGWGAFDDKVRMARGEILAAAPDAPTAAAGEAYLARVLTSCLADAFLSDLLCEGGLIKVFPTRGGANPDYLMSGTRIDPTRRYSVAGHLNDSERVGIGLYTLTAEGVMLLRGYAALDASTTQDGRFDLDLGPDDSGSVSLAIAPDASFLVVRILHRRPDSRPAEVRLHGGEQPSSLQVPARGVDDAFARAGVVLLNTVRQFLEWSRLTSAQPNRLASPPDEVAGSVQGDPGTIYYLGYFELDNDAWLEVTVQSRITGYWSLYAHNHWLDTAIAGIHDLSAVPDNDGCIRIRIGPGVPVKLANRVDTGDCRRGFLIWRSIGAENPGPLVRTAVRKPTG
ncbi:MAG: hypothetical protein ACLP9Y_28495 [Mycobacterium sp.]